VPFIDIRDAIAADVRALKVSHIGLLGTRYVVEQPFYGDHIEGAGGCKVVRANSDSNAFVHDIIYDELCRGIVTEPSRDRVLDIIKTLKEQGAEAVVLGCTELPMLRLNDLSPIPLLIRRPFMWKLVWILCRRANRRLLKIGEDIVR